MQGQLFRALFDSKSDMKSSLSRPASRRIEACFIEAQRILNAVVRSGREIPRRQKSLSQIAAFMFSGVE